MMAGMLRELRSLRWNFTLKPGEPLECSVFPRLEALVPYYLWDLAQTLAEEMRPAEKAYLPHRPRWVPDFRQLLSIPPKPEQLWHKEHPQQSSLTHTQHI